MFEYICLNIVNDIIYIYVYIYNIYLHDEFNGKYILLAFILLWEKYFNFNRDRVDFVLISNRDRQRAVNRVINNREEINHTSKSFFIFSLFGK